MLKPLHLRWVAGLVPAVLINSVLVFIFISGCSVNQARDVQVYRKVLDAGPRCVALSPFHSKDPLTLRQAMGLASAHNEQLAVAGENYLQVLIDKDRAFAAFLPSISLAPAFMHQDKVALGAGNSIIATLVPDHTTDVSVSGNFNLHPFRDLPALQAAGDSAQMQRALLLDSQAVLMMDVARTYFEVMYSEKKVRVLQYSIKVGQQRLKDMEVKQKAGVVLPVDVSLSQAQLAKTRNTLIQAKDDVKNGRAMLAFLIAVPAVKGQLTNGVNVPSTVWRIDSLLKQAHEHRQDLMAAHDHVKVAASALKAAWGEYFPSVSLNLAYYLSRDTFPNDVDWTSLIRVNLPIFSAGLIHADVRTAYSRLRQARLVESNIRRQVLKDLRVAVENLKRDDQQIGQLCIQVKAAKDGRLQAEAGFDAGLGTKLERLISEDGLLSAELALSAARFNQNIDYLNLLRVTGVLDPNISAALLSAKNNFHETK